MLRAEINANATTTRESYIYSPTGNILSKTGVGSYAYADSRHPYAVTQAGNDVFSYDLNGDLVSETRTGESIGYSYDYLNRLVSITNNAGVSTYIYGADANRVQKRLPDGSRLSYLGEYGEINEKGEYTDYFFADSDRVATSDLNGLFYNVDDHLSSASILTDSRGVIAQKLDYFPFGSERVNEKTGEFATRHTFTDQEKDSESGLLYYGARYYNPQIGRFTQIDPITLLIGQPDAFKARANRSLEFHLSNPQNLNTYSYVLNNPVKYTDPDGEIIPLLIGYAVMYSAPAIIAASAATAAALATWYYGSAIGYTIEGNYKAAQQSFNNTQSSLMIGAAGVGVGLSADSLLNVSAQSKSTTRFIGGAEVKYGNRTYKGTSDVQPTLNRIEQGVKYPHDNDGSIFRNDTPPILPSKPAGYYKEFVHPTPGETGAGTQRIITGYRGELYYSPDHYQSKPIRLDRR